MSECLKFFKIKNENLRKQDILGRNKSFGPFQNLEDVKLLIDPCFDAKQLFGLF